MRTISHYINNVYDGEYMTIGEAAKAVNRSVRTLKRWKEDGRVSCPRLFTLVGKSGHKVNLYTADDVNELREYAGIVRPGRPRSVK